MRREGEDSNDGMRERRELRFHEDGYLNESVVMKRVDKGFLDLRAAILPSGPKV